MSSFALAIAGFQVNEAVQNEAFSGRLWKTYTGTSVKLSLIAEKEIAKEKIFAAIAECGFKLFRIVTYSGTKLKTMESVTHVTTKICTPRRSDCLILARFMSNITLLGLYFHIEHGGDDEHQEHQRGVCRRKPVIACLQFFVHEHDGDIRPELPVSRHQNAPEILHGLNERENEHVFDLRREHGKVYHRHPLQERTAV